MKRLLTAIIIIAIVILTPVAIFASQIGVIIDGEQATFTYKQPVIVQGRVLVPIEELANSLGYTFEWLDTVQTAMLRCTTQTPASSVTLTMNSQVFTVNHRQNQPDVRAQIIDEVPMLPIRAVAEAMGHIVDWDDEQNAVIITTRVLPVTITIGNRLIGTSTTGLDLSGMGLQDADIEPLRYLPHLTWIDLSVNQISNIEPLAGLANLTWIDLSNNQISDISTLANLSHLETIVLWNNQINDISPLAQLTNITWLSLGINPITDWLPVSHIGFVGGRSWSWDLYTETTQDEEPEVETTQDAEDYITIGGENFGISYTWLDLSDMDLNDEDIVPLRYMTNLTSLYLMRNNISDLSPIVGLTNLEVLFLTDNQVGDISPLAGLTNLYSVSLMRNEIEDISPLAGLTNLRSLNLRFNQISDIGPLTELTGLYFLWMSDNQISHITPLAGLVDLVELDLANNPISNIELLAGLPNLYEVWLYGSQVTDWTPISHVQNIHKEPQFI